LYAARDNLNDVFTALNLCILTIKAQHVTFGFGKWCILAFGGQT